VACIAGLPGYHDSFADVIFESDSTDLLTGMRELLGSKTMMLTA
jgi:hypothetical protein